MAINNIINDQWQGHTHGEVEDALKALLAQMLQDIEVAGIPAGGVTADMLAQSLKTLINEKYSKPGTGIPASDLEGNIPSSKLAQAVQTSLAKADNSLQGVKDSSGHLLVPTNGVVTLPESEGGGSSVVPDAAMSSTSENTVQNKVIKAYVDNLIASLQNALDTLIGSGDVQGAIDTFNEVKAFLNGIDTDDPTLANQLLTLNNAIIALQTALAGKQNTLTFDNTPTANSNNPVKSGGIKTAIDNVTPTISQNGKWVIGGVESEVDAQGPRGNSILVNENAQGIQALIVNNVSDGGETDILSAEMGKVIRQNIMLIFNALGTYAFPEGKPVLNWGSTVIKYSINVNYVTGSLTITDVEVDGSSVGSCPSQIADGKSLSLKLTPPSGKSVKDDSVTITMGGVDITNDVYTASTDTIDIPAVTGGIVIVATSVNYDAEIEYIQSSGTQWIDTGVVWADGYRYELKAEFLQNGGNFDSILGARQTQGGSKFSVPLALQQDNRPYLQVAEGQAIVSNTTLGLYTFKGSQSGTALSLEVNGTTASGIVLGPATAATISLYMFARHRDDNADNSAAVAKIYYCKIWNGNTLVRDFIPVRVGQVGQLYDKVSGQFFTNIGTGSFTLGNDL